MICRMFKGYRWESELDFLNYAYSPFKSLTRHFFKHFFYFSSQFLAFEQMV